MDKLLSIGLMIGLVDHLTGPLSRVTNAVTGVGTAATGAAGKFEKLQQRVDKLGASAQKLEGLGKPLAAIGAVGAMGIQHTIAEFANLEEAQNRLKTNLMDQAGKVGPEFEKLNRLADKLGTDLPGTTKDMVEMFTALREQGVQTNMILGGMGEATAKFATVMKLPFAEAATHVAKFSESMGIADKDANEFMDTIQRLKSSSGVATGDLAYTFKYAGGALKLLNLQGIEAAKSFSTVVGVLASAGIEGSTAGTNMAQALSRMAEIGHKLDQKKIKELIGPILDAKGIKLSFFTEDGKFKGLREMTAELEKLKALNPQEQIIVLKKLFGDEAARPLAVLMKSGVAGYDAMTKRMKEQADMQQKITTIMGGLKMRWETLTGTVGNFTAHVGAVFAKLVHLPALLGIINNLFGRMDNWVLAHPTLAGIIGGVAFAVVGLAAAAGGLLLTMAALGTAVPAAMTGVGVSVTGIKAVINAVVARSELLNSGAPLKALAWRFTHLRAEFLATIVSARAWTVTQWGAARASWLNVAALKAKGMALAGSVRSATVAAITTTRLWIVTQYQSLTAAIAARGGLLGISHAFVGSMVPGIRAGILAVRAFSVALLTTPIGWVTLAIAGAAFLIYKYWKPISGFFRGMWTGLKEGLKGLEPAWNMFKKFAPVIFPILAPLKWLWNAIKALLKPVDDTGKAAENMGLRFGRALSGIVSAVLTLPGRMLQAGMNIITSLTDGMLRMINKPIEVMKNLATRLRRFLPFSPAKEGPLMDIHRVRIMETIAQSMPPGPVAQAMKHNMTLAMRYAGMATAGGAMALMPMLPMSQQQTPSQRPPAFTMPVQQSGPSGHGGTITFSPVIHINGAGADAGQIKAQVDQGMKNAYAEFETFMKRYEANNRRTGFKP